MLNRRMEVMAGEVLTTGKSTISGDKYATVILDFGRAAGNYHRAIGPLERHNLPAAG